MHFLNSTTSRVLVISLPLCWRDKFLFDPLTSQPMFHGTFENYFYNYLYEVEFDNPKMHQFTLWETITILGLRIQHVYHLRILDATYLILAMYINELIQHHEFIMCPHYCFDKLVVCNGSGDELVLYNAFGDELVACNGSIDE